MQRFKVFRLSYRRLVVFKDSSLTKRKDPVVKIVRKRVLTECLKPRDTQFSIEQINSNAALSEEANQRRSADQFRRITLILVFTR